jgi:hypothetical protein
MNTIINISAFVILTLLWLGFGAAILFKRDLLDNGWQTFRRLPILVQLAVTLLVLPVVGGLWIWHNRWPFWLRLTLVVSLAWVTIYTFFPRIPQA